MYMYSGFYPEIFCWGGGGGGENPHRAREARAQLGIHPCYKTPKAKVHFRGLVDRDIHGVQFSLNFGGGGDIPCCPLQIKPRYSCYAQYYNTISQLLTKL